MGLTALAIRNAKPRTKPYKLADERSLFLLVMPNGAKYWRLSFCAISTTVRAAQSRDSPFG